MVTQLLLCDKCGRLVENAGHGVFYSRSCRNTELVSMSFGLVDCNQVAFVRNIKNGKQLKSALYIVIEGHGVELVKFEDGSCCCSYDTCKGLTVRQLRKKLNKLSYDKLSEIRSLQDIFYGIGEE